MEKNLEKSSCLFLAAVIFTPSVSNFRCLSLDANSSDLSLERSKSLNKSLRASCVKKLGLFSESCSSNEVSLLESIESLEDDRLLELAGVWALEDHQNVVPVSMLMELQGKFFFFYSLLLTL